MDDRKKIVLGSEDIIVKKAEDIFINVNLKQTFSDIKPDKYNNNFDLLKQFRKERNSSRDFRVYGVIESTAIDCDNINIQVFKDSSFSDFICNINTTPIKYGEGNVFGKKKGKYLLELNNYDSDSVYFRIIGDMVKYGNQSFSQKLVFYGVDGEYIEYGTQTIDVGLSDVEFIEVDNDFPFFYNKHWIKKDYNLVEEKPVIIGFETEASVISEGQSISIDITLDKPSPFGNETLVLDAVLGTMLPADFKLFINNYQITFPFALDWSIGEQNKTLTFDAITDNVNEFSEEIRFDLIDLKFSKPGKITSHYVTIDDATPRKKITYNLGEIYKNRLTFTGREVNPTAFETAPVFSSAYSILRNGIHFDNSNEEFYPGDNYSIAIKNEGLDTIMPANPSIGINSEQLWLAGETKFINTDTSYFGQEKHKVKISFPMTSQTNYGTLKINGVKIPTFTFAVDYINVAKSILDGSSSDYIVESGFEKDWSAVGDGLSAITITSKSIGIPVSVDIKVTSSGVLNQSPIYAVPIVTEIEPFVIRNQIPKKITFYSNDANNSEAKYSFQFIKPGYTGLSVPAQSYPCSEAGVNKYLVTKFKYVSRNWDDTLNKCIYSTKNKTNLRASATESGGLPYQPNYLHPVGEAYINGSVLLSTNTLPGTKLNLTQMEPGFFIDGPLLVKPQTKDNLLSESITQLSRLTIPGIGKSDASEMTRLSNHCESFRSFDFRMGESGPFTTFYKSNTGFTQQDDMKWNSFVNVSGATTSGSGSLIAHLDTGLATIPPGPVKFLDSLGNPLSMFYSDSTFFLESKTLGESFEINNIVNAYVKVAEPGSYFVEALEVGDVLGPITTELIRPGGLSGISPNPAKNWMGGYNLDLETDLGVVNIITPAFINIPYFFP